VDLRARYDQDDRMYPDNPPPQKPPDRQSFAARMPARLGGRRLATHRLVEQPPHLMFVPRSGVQLLQLAGSVGFGLVGVGMTLGSAHAFWTGPDLLQRLAGLALLPFLLLGTWLLIRDMYRDMQRNRLLLFFDGEERSLRRGHRPGSWVGVPLDLGRVHAVMLMRETVASGEASTRLVYELTLALAGGEQVLLLDHGDLGRLNYDARVLARWLDVPFWDESRPRGRQGSSGR